MDTPDTQFTLTPAQWERMLERWDRAPWFGRAPLGSSFIGPEHILAVLHDYRRRRQHQYVHNVDLSCKVMLSSGEFLCTRHLVEPFLPRATQTSFERYEQRILELAGERSFSIEASRAHEADFELWRRARGFLDGLYRARGALPERAGVSVFVGNYPMTPFGVHADAAAGFMIGVRGRKRVLLFDGPSWEASGRAPHDYDELRAEAEIFHIEPGDMLYLPPHHYHVAENDGFSTTITIGLTWPRPFDVDSFVTATLTRLSHAQTPAPDAERVPGDPASMPEQLRAATQRLQARASSDELLLAAEAAWLRHRSSAAMAETPAKRDPVELPLDARLRPRLGGAVLTREIGGKLLIAANGWLVRLPAHAGLREWVERVNLPDDLELGPWCSMLPDDMIHVARGLAELLYQVRVLDRLGSAHA